MDTTVGYTLSIESVLVSLFGWSLVNIVLAKTVGFRFGKWVSVFVLTITWIIRFFGFSYYILTYLASKHGSESWFAGLMGLATVLNTFYGIAMFGILYRGNLQKNLILELLLEVLVVMVYLIVLTLQPSAFRTNDMGEWLLLVSFLLFLVFMMRYGLPWFKRYASWEPKHPIILNLVLIGYLMAGMYSNLSFAFSKTYYYIIIFAPAALFGFAYLWVAFFYEERKKAVKVNHELVRYEAALKNHYQQIIMQSTKCNRYNTEIRETIEALAERMTDVERRNPVDEITRETDEIEIDNIQKVYVRNEQQNMKELAEAYLDDLEQHYRQISVSRFSNDIRMNEMLVAFEDKCRKNQVSAQFGFSHYQKPVRVEQDDIEALLTFVFDRALERCKGCGEGMDRLFFRGGITGNELVVSCEYYGESPSTAERRKLRHLCRKMKADMMIRKEPDTVKIIVGMPTT